MTADLSTVIQPKSDQLNADDLIAGPRTITVTRVTVGSGEQPTSIYFEGDGGKPYKPCKSMCRVLVYLWGKDGTKYVGRQMTLYRDEKVKFAGVTVGGIRISHLSHIEGSASLALTETRGKRSPYRVQRLETAEPSPVARELLAAIEAAPDSATLEALVPRLAEVKSSLPAAEHTALRAAYGKRQKALTKESESK